MTITLRAGVLNSGIQQNGTEFLTVDSSNNVSLSAALPVLSGGTGVTTKTGTGAVVLGTSPTITGATITVAATAAPAFSAYLGTNQSISGSTFTKVLFNTEEFDTNSNYDNATNYRFTPTVAGYYQVSLSISYAASTNCNSTQAIIYKNGSSFKKTDQMVTTNGSNYAGLSALIFMNGSTDYVEGYAWGQTTPIVSNGLDRTFFQAVMVRSA